MTGARTTAPLTQKTAFFKKPHRWAARLPSTVAGNSPGAQLALAPAPAAAAGRVARRRNYLRAAIAASAAAAAKRPYSTGRAIVEYRWPTAFVIFG